MARSTAEPKGYQPSVKNLPPLEASQTYRAKDFHRFEFAASAAAGRQPILYLQMLNKAKIGLRTNETELRRLLAVLSDAYPSYALRLVQNREKEREAGRKAKKNP